MNARPSGLFVPVQPTGYWLTPSEQEMACDALLHFRLTKSADKLTLPTKSGLMTDIYINQRDARNDPQAMWYLAELYAPAILRLRPDWIAEVPDAVSCFASIVSVMTGIPLVTVREKQKEGRATSGVFVGNPDIRPGQTVVLLDDVVTDGASKVAAYRALTAAGLKVKDIVVLVDRQQGWKKKFAELGIPLNVWAGMTLHDLRRMFMARGLIRGATPEALAGNSLIVALDGMTFEELLPVLEALRGSGVILKANDLAARVGLEWLLPNLSVYGPLMIDLKWHDIPNTILNYAKLLVQYPPWAFTVHGSAARKGLKAVVEFVRSNNLPSKVLVITALTSLDEIDCPEVYNASPLETVQKLAGLAANCGADGVVCSPLEARILRQQHRDLLLVTPGIRTDADAKDDQERVATPEGAKAAGANFQVVGRPVMKAADPAKAAAALQARIAAA